MNKKITEQQLIEYLKKLSNEPSHEWIQSTSAQLAERSPKDSNYSNFNIFTYIPMNNKLLIGLSLFTVTTVSLIVGILFVNTKTDKDSVSLSQEEKSEIYRKILENNSQSTITAVANSSNNVAISKADSNLAQGTAFNMTIAADPSFSTMPAYNPFEMFNYSESTLTSTFGPAYNKCGFGFNSTKAENSTEISKYYSYFEKDTTTSYSEYGTYSDNGSVLYYGLSKNNNTSSESYDYRGGKFAIKQTSIFNPDVMLIDPTSVLPVPIEDIPSDVATIPEDPEALIKQYFGENTDIKDIIEKEGKKYYVIETSYGITCGEATYIGFIPKYWTQGDEQQVEPERTNMMIDRTWVDSETFRLSRSESYLDSVSTDNLIVKTSNTDSNKNITRDEADKVFAFDYPNVEIKETVFDSNMPVDTADNSDLFAKLRGYLTTNKKIILFPESGYNFETFSSNEIDSYRYEQQSGTDYYAQRDFYADDDNGQAQYDEYTNLVSTNTSAEMPATDLYYSFSSGNTYFSIASYKETHIDEQLLDVNVYQVPITKGQEAVSVSIDGEDVDAMLYTYTYEDQAFYEFNDDGTPKDKDCSNSKCIVNSYILILKLDGKKYVISESSYSDQGSLNTSYDYNKFKDLKLKAFDTTLDFTILEPKLKAIYTTLNEVYL